MPEAGGEVRPRFEVSGRGLVAAGRPRPVPGYSDLLSGALGPRVGAVDAPWVRGSSLRARRSPSWRRWPGTKRRTLERAEGRRAGHPRAQPPRAPPAGPAPGKSPLAAPAHPSRHCTQQRARHLPPPPPKVWADCKSCCSVIVGQTGPFSRERGAGHVADPGQGLY